MVVLSTLHIWLHFKRKQNIPRYYMLILLCSTVDRTISKRWKIENVHFRSLAINVKQESTVFCQADKLQVREVVNPEFCDKKCQEICVFLQWYQSISDNWLLYIGTRPSVSTSKVCKKYMQKVHVEKWPFGKTPELGLQLCLNYTPLHLFVEMNWLVFVWWENWPKMG